MKIQNITLLVCTAVIGASLVTFAITRPSAPKNAAPPRTPTESERLASRFTNSVNWDSFWLKTTAEIKGTLITHKQVVIIDCALDDVDVADDYAVAVFDTFGGKFSLAIRAADGSQLIKAGKMSRWAVAAVITEVGRVPWDDMTGVSKLRVKGACVAIEPISPGPMSVN